MVTVTVTDTEGAGDADDFVDKDSFQKHLKRVKNRKKRKR
jgi:hypothetical protein